jgi:hypothetical protein
MFGPKMTEAVQNELKGKSVAQELASCANWPRAFLEFQKREDILQIL